MMIGVEKEGGKIPGTEIQRTVNDPERRFIMLLLEGNNLEELYVSDSDLAQGLSLKFDGDKGKSVYAIRPGLLRATYLSVLNGQIPFEDSLLEKQDLTSQQKETVKLMSEGKSNKQIAKDMCITESDVSQRSRSIVERWKVANPFQVMAIAAKKRILE